MVSGSGKCQAWVPGLVATLWKEANKSYHRECSLKIQKGESPMYLLSGAILRGFRARTLPPRGHSCATSCVPGTAEAPCLLRYVLFIPTWAMLQVLQCISTTQMQDVGFQEVL